MNINEYEEMYRLENFYWWFVARRKLLRQLITEIVGKLDKPAILDVGCGTGMNFSILSQFGNTFSSDASEEALKFCKSRSMNGLVCSRSEALPFSSESFDIITALDVLEHIDDDLKAMGELRRIMKSEGRLVITVPAHGFLWSEHDEALHHRRRYSASELRNKLVASGFKVEQMSYYITILFFPILVMRFLQSLRKNSIYPKTSHIILPGWLNSFLIGLLDFERILLKWIRLPIGVSIVCLARKSDDHSS